MRSKRFVSATVLALALSLAVSCNGVQAAIDAFIGLSASAIALNQSTNPATGQPRLSTADTGAILTYASQAIIVLQAQASGWKATVQAGWGTALVDIQKNHPNASTGLTTALGLVTAAVNAL
jgi:hypothetical protein